MLFWHQGQVVFIFIRSSFGSKGIGLMVHVLCPKLQSSIDNLREFFLIPHDTKKANPVGLASLRYATARDCVTSSFRDLTSRQPPPTPATTYATISLNNGVPLAVVSQLLGHKQISTTLDTYSHCMTHERERHRGCDRRASCHFV